MVHQSACAYLYSAKRGGLSTRVLRETRDILAIYLRYTCDMVQPFHNIMLHDIDIAWKLFPGNISFFGVERSPSLMQNGAVIAPPRPIQ